jgi:hypothetical protein
MAGELASEGAERQQRRCLERGARREVVRERARWREDSGIDTGVPAPARLAEGLRGIGALDQRLTRIPREGTTAGRTTRRRPIAADLHAAQRIDSAVHDQRKCRSRVAVSTCIGARKRMDGGLR